MIKSMYIILNGRARILPDTKKISYEELCIEAGINPKLNPTIVYSTYNTQGTVTSGKKVPLIKGAIYNVHVTGNS